MPQFIISADMKAFNIFSTTVDGCHYEKAFTYEDLVDLVRFEQGQVGVDTLAVRLDRVRAKGCSGNTWTLDDCINSTHVQGELLTREEFIKRYLTL